MNNKQYSKCPKCGEDEKYVVWFSNKDTLKEVRVCAKQCNIDKKGKK